MDKKEKDRFGKFCYECEHFHFCSGQESYSEDTPGWDASMFCRKRYWFLDFEKDNRKTFYKKIRYARTCQDFAEDATLYNVQDRE